MQNERLTNFWRWRILNNNIKKCFDREKVSCLGVSESRRLVRGGTRDDATGPWAAAWTQCSVSRSGRVLRRYQRSSIRWIGWYDKVGAIAPMRMVPRKCRFRFLITGNESVFCYLHRFQSYHYWNTKRHDAQERKADSNEKCKQISERVFSPPNLWNEMDAEGLHRQSSHLVQRGPSRRQPVANYPHELRGKSRIL